jgi:tetratricopeptide (TPR) repeat protein
VALVAIALVLAVALVYAPVREHQFVNFDDPDYVSANPHVQAGLTLDGVRWAFTSAHARLWHPVTSLSHLADWTLFGGWAGGHHLVSVALHVANAVLVLVLLERATGLLGPSAAVAALFALHPLRVESVAWAAERKDVLSLFFGLVAIAAYVAWTRRGGRARYAAFLAASALALMAKAMLVTLPVLLLLLDVWPLGRLEHGWQGLRDRIREKLPLFVMAVGVGVVTWLVQSAGGAVVDTHSLPLVPRVANAVVSYARYLWLAVWPTGLAVYYPYSAHAPLAVGGALVVLAALSAFAVQQAARRPYLLVGWLWYLVALAPVIGIAQAGEQAMADRFTYLPLLGPLVAVVWLANDLTPGRAGLRHAVTAGVVVLASAYAVASARQVAYWHDSASLFTRAVAVTQGNHLAHANLGQALEAQGRMDEAIGHYLEALRIRPGYAVASNNLGNEALGRGDLAAARRYYTDAIRDQPLMAEAQNGLGSVLAAEGQLEAAVEAFEAALRLRPEYAPAHTNAGAVLARLGRLDRAAAHYQAALVLVPDDVDTHLALGGIHAGQGRQEEAVRHFRAALALRPDPALAREIERLTDPRRDRPVAAGVPAPERQVPR